MYLFHHSTLIIKLQKFPFNNKGYMILYGYSSRGGEKRIKTGVKLACKTDFIRFSTSGERPMLLIR